MRRSDDEADVRALYRAIIDGWNADDAAAFAAPFAPDGVVIGFDGSEIRGRRGHRSGDGGDLRTTTRPGPT